MDNFKFHLDKIILRSEFKVFESDSPYYNSFLDQSGELISCESHHHVETALDIIARIDEKQKRNNRTHYDYLRGCKNDLKKFEKLKLLLTENPNLNVTKSMIPKGWFYQYWLGIGNVTIEDLDKNIVDEKDRIERNQKYVDELKTKMYELKKFEAANKNKGYDAAEYLIINQGYIAIEDGHLLYDSRSRISNTQLEEVKCKSISYQEDGINYIVIKKTEKELQKERNEIVSKLTSMASNFRETSDRFHCPSGFPRRSYLDWRAKCRKYGIDIRF